ncbi:phage tail protein [Brucella sp. JSBI001]|uniref:phage tail-collar fiber domain-containing protein n=1 Tax=Brucella sp. JSBI001 TaxID=2886044 RepID=UPI00222EEE5B|nr:phage tail protein [Brucella sp. JSBI001]UZD70818.1 phage tail protein [Brucella sp. JSBI001]
MAQNSFALMTNLGRAKEAAALANGTAIVITHIAIGDGTTVPSGGETALYHEVSRKAISGHGTVAGASNVAYFDIFLAAAEGPYTIREAGLYDDAGDLIAIARYDPPINKPVPASGQTVEGTVRLEVAFSNIASVTIVVDPAFTVPLQRLSRLPWIPVLSMSVTAPPATPAIGDAFLVPTGSTGSWAGQSGKIAEFTAAGWGIITPPDGHGVSLPDGRVFEKIGGAYVEKLALDAQSGKWNYAAVGGTATALTVNLTPAPLAYVAGMVVNVLMSSDCQGPSTLSVNGLPAKSIVRAYDQAPVKSKDWRTGALSSFVYDGTRFQFLAANNLPSPLNRIENPATATVNLTAAALGGMFYGSNVRTTTYNLPKASDFGVGYIGFMNNLNQPVIVNAATSVPGSDTFQFSNNPLLATVTLDYKSWLVLLSDGNNWLIFSADAAINAKLGQTLAVNGIKKHDGGLIEQWGSSVVVTNASGYGTIYLPEAFPTSNFMVVACNGTADASFGGKPVSIFPIPAVDAFNFYIDAPSTTVRINWMAKGR